MGCADQRPTKTEPAFVTHSRSRAVIDCKVFRRQAIGDCARFVEICRDDHQAVAAERFAGDRILAAAQLGFGNNFFGQIGARGDKDRQRFGIVLGLRDQVSSDVGGVAAVRW